MRGRDLFTLVAPGLIAISYVLRLFPRTIATATWPALDLLPGSIGAGLRYAWALRLAKRIGRNVLFSRGVEVRVWDKLELGDNVSVHKDCYLDASGGITIEENCSIAHGCSLLSFDHSWNDPHLPIRDNPIRLAPVLIMTDVWIGCGCRILSGVTVGPRSIVAAGAVVVDNVAPNTVAGGVPARLIKRL